jgi:hypothetical protein
MNGRLGGPQSRSPQFGEEPFTYSSTHRSISPSTPPYPIHSRLFITSELSFLPLGATALGEPSELNKTNLKGVHLAGNIEIDQESCFAYRQTFWIIKLLVHAAMQ